MKKTKKRIKKSKLQVERRKLEKKNRKQREKRQQQKDLTEARKIYKSLPKRVRLTNWKRGYYFLGILSSTIVVIYFISLFIKDIIN